MGIFFWQSLCACYTKKQPQPKLQLKVIYHVYLKNKNDSKYKEEHKNEHKSTLVLYRDCVDDNLVRLNEANKNIQTNNGVTERQSLTDLVLQGDTCGCILAPVQGEEV